MIPLAVLAVSVLRVYAVTRFNYAESMVVLRVIDRTQLLVGTATMLLLFVPGLATFTMPLVRRYSLGLPERALAFVRRRYWYIAATLYVWTIFRASLFTLLVILALSYLAGYVLYPLVTFLDRWKLTSTLAAAIAFFPILIGGVLLPLSLVYGFLTTPPSPLERITMSDDRVVTQVRAMGEEDGSLVVMHPSSRLEWVKVDDISTRTLCVMTSDDDLASQLRDLLAKTNYADLNDLLFKKPSYPSCT